MFIVNAVFAVNAVKNYVYFTAGTNANAMFAQIESQEHIQWDILRRLSEHALDTCLTFGYGMETVLGYWSSPYQGYSIVLTSVSLNSA